MAAASRSTEPRVPFLDLAQLSHREVEVLDRAIAGDTDQQMALALGITASTVNSYWVRIRGKLGQLSRTELVSKVLQQRTTEEIAELTERAERAEAVNAAYRTREADEPRNELLRSTIESCPEAMIVVDSEAKVVLANEKGSDLFGYQHSEDMIGLDLADLVQSVQRDHESLAFLCSVTGPKKELGVASWLEGHRLDGSTFPLALVIGTRHEGPKRVVCCLVMPQ